MNIKKNYTITLSFFLLFFYSQTQPMGHSSLTSKEKATIGLVIGGFLVTSYGFYRFLTWIYPPKNTTRKNIPHQSFGNIISGGDIEMRQTGSSSNSKANVKIQYVNDQLSVDQSKGKTNITQTQITKNGILFNRLNITFKSETSLKNIKTLGIVPINVHETSHKQLIVFQYPVKNCPNFSLALEDNTLSYQSSVDPTLNKSSLDVWVHNKDAVIVRST